MNANLKLHLASCESYLGNVRAALERSDLDDALTRIEILKKVVQELSDAIKRRKVEPS